MLAIMTCGILAIMGVIHGQSHCDPEDCTCSGDTQAGYQVDCPKSNQQLSVSQLKLQYLPHVSVTLVCTTSKVDYRWLAGLEFEQVPLVSFTGCPLPDPSLSQFLLSMGIINISTIIFQSNMNLDDSLLQHHLEGLNYTTSLIFSLNGLTKLTQGIFQTMSNLKALDLHSNNLNLQPDLFTEKPNLTKLDLGMNNIDFIQPYTFQKLNSLEVLGLWGNNLQNISRAMFSGLSNLISLDLSTNDISSISEDVFVDLRELRNLSLARNSLQLLPGKLFDRNLFLEKLELNDNTELSSLAASVLTDLPSLKEVYWQNCNLSQLPQSLFWGSSSIINLNISNNIITNLPQLLFKDASNLFQLHITHNKLRTFPDFIFSTLHQLQILNLEYNNITVITSSMLHGLLNLRHLNLNHNAIYHIHSHAFNNNRNLLTLHLSHNYISFKIINKTEQWSPMHYCTSLQDVKLDHNQIEDISPDWRTILLNLRQLNLSNNAIAKLEFQDLLFNSRHLTVDMTNNQIRSIDLSEAEATIMKEGFSNDRNVNIKLYNNPLNCDCLIYDLLRYMELKISPEVHAMMNLELSDLLCASPQDMVGISVDMLQSHKLTCPLMDRCPCQCFCTVHAENRLLTVNCSGKALSEIPLELPHADNIFAIELYLDHNLLSSLPEYAPSTYSKVTKLSLSHNNIRELRNSFLPPNLQVLLLNHNNLTHIARLPIESISKLQEITLYGNPWDCDCEQQQLINSLRQHHKIQNSTNDMISAPNHINTNVWAGHIAQPTAAAHGACLTSSDLDRLRGLVQDFCVKGLLPYVERQIQLLSDLVSNKKGVSRSLLSATKRWFGSNKPGLPSLTAPANAVVYASDAPELQLRRLGDLCFMFGHYALAFQMYHSAKRDFNADQAWLYYAGALEMASLSAFMQGESSRKAQEYMEESIVTYLNSCKMPQFATRATLLSTECLKGRGLYGEAAQQFIRMTSEDSDLRSALLLEQASYCFLKASRPRMARKYAFHMVLAGHRFVKAGQRQHSMRCYRQAYQVYENKCWSLAEDHIHLTTGHQAANVKQLAESAKAFAKLLTPMSRQAGAQQAVYLRDFLAIQQQLTPSDGKNENSLLPVLPLPLVDQDSVRILVGPLPPIPPPPRPDEPTLIPATGVTFDDDLPDSTIRWSKLEEALVSDAQGSLPMIFKPTVTMFSNRTNNTSSPVSVVGEPVNVRMCLHNPLRTALPLQQLQLLWSLEVQGEQISGSRNNQAHAQCLETLLLPPDSLKEIVLSIVPQCVGTLHIVGVSYRLVSPLPEPGPLASPDVEPGTLAVTGKQVFTPRNIRQVKGSKEPVMDKRLQIVVTPHAPCLQVNFTGLNSEMLCGELHQVTMEFCNIGNAPLTNLRVATSTPALFVLRGRTAHHGGCRVSNIPLNKPLAPGHRHSIPMWLRAPDTSGTATLDMLVYYENVSASSGPRYRLVRHSWQLSLLSSVQLVGTAQNTRSSNKSGEQRAINIVFQVKNCNQVHDPVMTEVSLVQVSTSSLLWRLSNTLAVPAENKLQSQEIVHLVLKACRQVKQENSRLVFSDLPLDRSNLHLETVNSSPYLDFFNCFMEPTNSNNEVPDGPSDTLCATLGITIILRWQACVTISEGKKRTALGQHYLRIESVGKQAIWPPDLTPAATDALNTQPDGPLRIFGPDATLSQSSSSAVPYPSLDVLQKLVTYSIQHSSQIIHNFEHSRLCVVPVQMRLQNCSDRQLLVKIKTVGSSSTPLVNKNQLYSPHAASTFGWVGLAEAWLELDAHRTTAVGLMAAIGAPGTFDLGSRLEVWCREVGAPVADAVSQSWRVESALIVKSPES